MTSKYWLLSLCAGMLAYSCTNPPEQNDAPERFRVMHPIIKDTVVTKEYVADIQSVRHIEIRARLRGFIEKVHVDEGQSVKKGQLLFTLSSREYREALTKARAAQKSASAELKTAQVELKNVKRLLEKKLVAASELEFANAKLATAEAKIEDANADEANALLNLSFAEIRAPFAGTINRIPKKAGSLVEEGELLTTLSDPGQVFAYFYLSEKEHLGHVANHNVTGLREVELLLADGSLFPETGKIETIESEINRSTGNIGFRARFKNPDNTLKHGSSGKIRLRTPLKNAMLIWQKSTQDIQEKIFVYTVDKGGLVVKKPIVPLTELPNMYVVASGLLPRDLVIYEGVQLAKEGDKVETVLIDESNKSTQP